MRFLKVLALYVIVFDVIECAAPPLRVIDLSTNFPSQFLLNNSALSPVDERSHMNALNNETFLNTDSGDNESSKPVIYMTNSRNDIKKPKVGDLLENENTIIYFKDTKSTVFYDKEEKEWIELQFEKPEKPAKEKPFPRLIPVTSCIDSGYGDGGSITLSYTSSLQITDSLSLTGMAAIAEFAFSAMLGTSVSVSYTYSESFVCNVNKGQYGQLFIEPFYVEVPKSKRRKVAYKRYRGLVAKTELFEEILKFKLIAKHKPNHYCIADTNPSRLSCSKKVTEHQFKQSELD